MSYDEEALALQNKILPTRPLRQFATAGDLPSVGQSGIGYIVLDEDAMYLWDADSSSYTASSLPGAPFAGPTVAGLVKQLTGPGIAPADTSVRGDDIRLGARGGVRLAGDPGALPGHGRAVSYSLGSEFTLLFDLIAAGAGSNYALGAIFNGTDEYSLNFGSIGGDAKLTVDRNGAHPGGATGLPWAGFIGRRCVLAFVYSTDGWKFYLAGTELTVSLGPGTLPVGSSWTISRLLGGLAGGYGQFEGNVLDFRAFNAALTADEIIAVAKGEVPASIASRGGVAQSSGSLIVGHEYRITSVTGGASFTGVGASANTVGVVFVATGTSPTWGSGSLETVGTVEHFAADQVTSLGRWIGKFGTSLTPVSGITPLDPQPVQTRVARFREDLAGSVNASGAGPMFTLTDSGAGVLTITPNAFIAGTLPVATASTDTSGPNAITVVTNTSTGVVTITNIVTGAPTDAVVQGAVFWTE